MKRLHGLSGKFAVVAALTCVTMFGTGYAAWNFSKTAEINKSNTTVITETDPKGSLAVNPETFYLVIDQSGVFFSTDNTTTGVVDESKKITSLTLTYEGSGQATQEYIKLTTTFDASAYNEYLTFTAAKDSSPITQKYEGNGTKLEFTYTLPTVTFIDNKIVNKKPQNVEDYTTMNTALKDASITFKFEASVVTSLDA